MPLDNEIRSYLFGSPYGRLISGNAIGGARIGLHSAAATIEYARATYSLYLTRKAATGKTASIRDFEDCLCDLRYRDYVHGKQRQINDEIIPLFGPNLPNLASKRLATVIELKWLPLLMTEADKDRLKIDFPVGGLPKNPDRFARRLRRLGADRRYFRLAGNQFLGRKLVWFTTEAEARRLKKSGRNGAGLAFSFCSGLGLGHHPPGAWLVLLTIPGAAIQKAGHYRPAFCDAGIHRWFMARSSISGGKVGLWGQTAELESLARGYAPYDGGPERVSRELASDHFDDATIGFELLGQVNLATASRSASTRLCSDVWIRRR
jgi:hypothetical protein